MSNKEAFLPLATAEPDDLAVPMYSPDGPFGAASGSAAAPGNRGNHLYCNYCCDSRRAVLSVNSISIVINIVTLLVVNVGLNYMSKHPDEIEQNMSEEDAKNFDAAVKNGSVQMMEAMMDAFLVIAMFMHACGIYGALKFKKWGVATAASAYVISFLLNLIGFDFINLVIAVALGYPHYFLIKEINEGIMTDYNYHNVASCLKIHV
jgi:hypothetical protein